MVPLPRNDIFQYFIMYLFMVFNILSITHPTKCRELLPVTVWEHWHHGYNNSYSGVPQLYIMSMVSVGTRSHIFWLSIRDVGSLKILAGYIHNWGHLI